MKKVKKTVYFDTTIPSFLFDDRVELEFIISATKKWWDNESNLYRIVLSDETLRELSSGNYPNKNNIINFALQFEVLPFINDITDIVSVYAQNHIMPTKSLGDAIHLAYTSYYKIDFLLTWNCNHLANANKKGHIRVINNKLGLFVPEIITPLELMTEEN